MSVIVILFGEIKDKEHSNYSTANHIIFAAIITVYQF